MRVAVTTRKYQHVKHVQGHKVKCFNRYNSAADCSIAFKVGSVSLHHRRYASDVHGQRSKVKVTGSEVKFTV